MKSTVGKELARVFSKDSFDQIARHCDFSEKLLHGNIDAHFALNGIDDDLRDMMNDRDTFKMLATFLREAMK